VSSARMAFGYDTTQQKSYARRSVFAQPSPIRSIVCHDASRAWETAHTVAAECHVEPVANPGLRERNFGALIGTSSLNLDWACAPEDGESLPQFMRRVHAALNDALAHPSPVLVVAHGGRSMHWSRCWVSGLSHRANCSAMLSPCVFSAAIPFDCLVRCFSMRQTQSGRYNLLNNK